MNSSDKKILYLILKKQPFDQIKRGKKTSEFREHKPFWVKRLMKNDGTFKQFDLVHFKNGYHTDAPTMLIEIKDIKIIKERISWFSSEKYFEIVLGRLIKTESSSYSKPH